MSERGSLNQVLTGVSSRSLSGWAGSGPDLVRRDGVKGGSRPISRVLSWATIPLGRTSPCISSGLPGSPREPRVAARRLPASLFGLAPGGVCRAVGVTVDAVRSYRTLSPLPARSRRAWAVCFLLHFPWAHAPQALPGASPCGARTFLRFRLENGGCLADSHVQHRALRRLVQGLRSCIARA